MRSYYPPGARRKGLTGRVGLECSVDAGGKAQNLVVVESAGSELDEAAKSYVADAQFRIPDDWVAQGGPATRVRVGVIFQLTNKPKVPGFDDGRPAVIITGQGLPGS